MCEYSRKRRMSDLFLYTSSWKISVFRLIESEEIEELFSIEQASRRCDLASLIADNSVSFSGIFTSAAIEKRLSNDLRLWFPWNPFVPEHVAREMALAQRSFYSVTRLFELTIIFRMSLSAFQIDLPGTRARLMHDNCKIHRIPRSRTWRVCVCWARARTRVRALNWTQTCCNSFRVSNWSKINSVYIENQHEA